MSLILSTGTNLGDRIKNLSEARNLLANQFQLIASSKIYQSKAVDYLDQPDFLNQVLEFNIPDQIPPKEVLKIILNLEQKMGRIRSIPKGPRTIDIDLLFWQTENISLPDLEVPHPRLFSRSFIVKPLLELPYAATLKNHYDFSQTFSNNAEVYTPNA